VGVATDKPKDRDDIDLDLVELPRAEELLGRIGRAHAHVQIAGRLLSQFQCPIDALGHERDARAPFARIR
jgi:hypothetical protein